MRRPIGKIRLAGLPPFTGDASRAWESAWPLYEPLLTRLAKRLTDDQDQREDLLHEAMIKLWKTDPTRFDFREKKEVRYLQKILVHRMWKVWSVERKNQLYVITDDGEWASVSELMSWRERWEAMRRRDARNW
jgi:DNA-directed RNA polymerase specialized sigma24 family protein